jgi:hypothetical protein
MTNDNTNATAAAEADLAGAQATLEKIRAKQAETLSALEEARAEFANISMFAEVSEEWLVSRDTLRTAIEAKERRLTDLKAAEHGAKATVELAHGLVLASRQVADRQAAAECWDRAASTAEQVHDTLVVAGNLWASMQEDLHRAVCLIEPHLPETQRVHYSRKPDLLDAFRFILGTAGGPYFGDQGINHWYFTKSPPSMGGMVASATAKLQARLDADLGKLPAANPSSDEEKAA